jgi:hypothetical protein
MYKMKLTPGADSMNKRLYPLTFLCFLLFACSSESELRPFTSDGCTLFPDKSLISADDWCSCCLRHDLAYWRGGTTEQRKVADQELRDCVLERTGNQALATMMYDGVRLGGSPYFYNWYRWGYGWSYERKYQALTPEEEKQADLLEAEYLARNPEPVCYIY